MKCGDICLVQFPYTDQSGGKVRPVLVVTVDSHNTGQDVVVVPISSRPDAADPHSFHFDSNESFFSETGLSCSSAAKWTKPHTVAKSIIRRKLGRLREPQLASVRQFVASLFQ